MITKKDLYNIIENKMVNDIGKSLLRKSIPPHIAEQLCDSIDRSDDAEKFNRILTEYNDWMIEQQHQQWLYTRVFAGEVERAK